MNQTSILKTQEAPPRSSDMLVDSFKTQKRARILNFSQRVIAICLMRNNQPNTRGFYIISSSAAAAGLIAEAWREFCVCVTVN